MTNREIHDVKVGNAVRSFDFPFSKNNYIEGRVVSIKEGRMEIQARLIIKDGLPIIPSKNKKIFTSLEKYSNWQDRIVVLDMETA